MSFLSVLKTIGHFVAIGAAGIAPAAPALGAIPVAGPIITTVLGAIAAVEQLIPQLGVGAIKKQIVTNIVSTAVPGVDTTALSPVIDEIVAAMNALAAAFHHTAVVAAKAPEPPPAPVAPPVP